GFGWGGSPERPPAIEVNRPHPESSRARDLFARQAVLVVDPATEPGREKILPEQDRHRHTESICSGSKRLQTDRLARLRVASRESIFEFRTVHFLAAARLLAGAI